MAKLAKKDETVFQSLAESMLAGQIDFTVGSFSDSSGTIAIEASALTTLCMLYCIWSFFKIRKLTTILTVTHISSPTTAFPTQHPSLLSYYNNGPNTESPSSILQNIYKSFHNTMAICYTFCFHYFTYLFLCTQTMEQIQTNTENHTSDRTHFWNDCILIPLLTLPLCPDNWNIQPPQVTQHINYAEYTLFGQTSI